MSNIIKEFFTYLSGQRESCEDSVCAECGKKKSQAEYKSCKQKCFIDNEDKILECCLRGCQTGDCMIACQNKMAYR
jgi:hypothetical protein